jgi:hypothetical protein
MPALLTAHDSTGRTIGRCDERCYLAQHNHCRCICGGACHGLGLQAAAKVARKITEADYAGLDTPQPGGSVTIRHHRALPLLASNRLFSDD